VQNTAFSAELAKLTEFHIIQYSAL